MTQNNENQGGSNQSEQSSQQDQPETPLSEKLVGVVGLLLVLATIGFLIYQGLQPEGPPDIVIEVTNVVSQETGYLVEITVTNRGDLTAEELMVTGELMLEQPTDSQDGQSSQPVEIAQVTFGFVPPRSQRQGGLLFSYNPLDYDLELRAGGFTRP